MNHPSFAVLGFVLIAATSCGNARRSADDADVPSAHRRFGEVMTEVGRRFERSGRAVAAGRWDFAAYDVGEIGEIFENDIPTAIPPPEVRIDLHALARTFAGTHPAALAQAVAAHDRGSFETAFAAAAAVCNGCHLAAGKGFIQVPIVLGAPVPMLNDVSAPDAGP